MRNNQDLTKNVNITFDIIFLYFYKKFFIYIFLTYFYIMLNLNNIFEKKLFESITKIILNLTKFKKNNIQ